MTFRRDIIFLIVLALCVVVLVAVVNFDAISRKQLHRLRLDDARKRARTFIDNSTFKPFRMHFADENMRDGGRARLMETILAVWNMEHPVPPLPQCDPHELETVPIDAPVFFDNPRPQIALLSIHAFNLSNRSSMHSAIHRASFLPLVAYARRRRYDLIIEDGGIVDKRRKPHWSKVRALRKWLQFYKYVVWIDADIIMTDLDFSFEKFIESRQQLRAEENNVIRKFGHANAATKPPHFDIMIGSDFNGINSGVCVWRNSAFTFGFLKRMWGVPQKLADPFYDQGALDYLTRVDSDNPSRMYRGRPRDAAERDNARLDVNAVLNRYPAGMLAFSGQNPDRWVWTEGRDPLVHLANCKSNPACASWLGYFNAYVSCKYSLDLKLTAARQARIPQPFYRALENATAPPLDEALEPFPTLMRSYEWHHPRLRNFKNKAPSSIIN